jgi:hypothetical protein
MSSIPIEKIKTILTLYRAKLITLHVCGYPLKSVCWKICFTLPTNLPPSRPPARRCSRTGLRLTLKTAIVASVIDRQSSQSLFAPPLKPNPSPRHPQQVVRGGEVTQAAALR